MSTALNLDLNIYNSETIEKVTREIIDNSQSYDGCGYVEIVQIAKFLGLIVKSAIFANENISGLLKYDDCEKCIYINKTQSETHQRFTIAHEIGHFILHRNLIEKQQGSVFYRKVDNKNPIERQANSFAAALLLPREDLIKAYNVCKDIGFLSGIFYVSPECCYYRLKNLGVL